ncbi:hypothetical protein BJX70DRAFT_370229 [Aspergillus crustosus]
MAPVKFTMPPDLSGRTPIYRLSKNTPLPQPQPQPQPQPTPPLPGPSQVHSNGAIPYHQQPHPHPQQQQQPQQQPNPPYHASPYSSPYPSSQPGSQPQSTPQPTPQDNKENTPVLTPQQHLARGSPLTKRRGRKLQEHETLILINCCLEYQSLYHGNPQRFWYCVATSLKRQIKRNFSWQSCQQIVEELVTERRDRRRDVAAGKTKEQPLTELVLATDKWISFSDAPPGTLAMPVPVHPPKRSLQYESPISDPNAAKRPRQNDQATPSIPQSLPHQGSHAPHPVQQPAPIPLGQPLPPQYTSTGPIPTIPSGPTISDYQTMKVDIQSLRMDLQAMRRGMIEVRNDITTKLDLILQSIQQGKALDESKEG